MNVAQAERQLIETNDNLNVGATSDLNGQAKNQAKSPSSKDLSNNSEQPQADNNSTTDSNEARLHDHSLIWPSPKAIWASSFAALNLALFHLALLSPLYSQSEEQLRAFFAWISIGLSLWLAWEVVLPKLKLAWQDIKRLTVSGQVLESLALSLSLGYSLFAVAFEFHIFAQQPFFRSFIILSLVIVLKDLALQRFAARIATARAFQVRDQVGRIRLINRVADVDQRLVANAAATNTNLPDSQYTWVEAHHARPGDLFYVMAGELIPCDAVVVSGSGEVQERKLTALFYTRFKRRGDEVFAGSRVVSGSLTCKVTLALEDSNASAMEEIVKGSLTSLTEHLSRNKRLEHYCNLALLVLTGFIAQFWVLQGARVRSVVDVTVALLVVGLVPLALRMGPELVRLAVASAFRKGIILKDCRVLDRISFSKTLAIDLRPEEQIGEPRVTNFEIVDTRIDEKGMLAALSVLLSQSEDPLYHSALEFFRKKVSFSPIHLEVKDFKSYPGLGICGLVEGADFTIGSEEFLLARGVQLQSSEILPNSDKENHLYVALGEDLIARFSIASGLRAYGPALIQELRKAHIRTIVLSEAESRVVDPIGKSMGLELADIHAGLDRVSLLKKIQMFEPLLLFATPKTSIEKIAESSSSISVFDELLWDAKRTDITLFRNDFGLIALLVRLARRIQTIAGQNRFYAVMVSALMIIVAGTGLMPSGLVAFFMLLSVMLLYWNSLRVSE